ncbi:two component transcriptional regulator, LuxR family [Caldalkalibacillus thermarum TA2.A1]|uniref:Response regulator transcription factor n=1 Tax=Caldalkalibacillus thermarum (strain TA2.A1) TaxID=986075 RepID=F5L8J7_CALTT|nr:response regulator transcription factor [Caldalkalibacillus thermarum]EGL82336.1 two component transcriptional regulator, LuxR family [Caldalkalibacillus thermarum TA2.A1]QZT32898.1 response regulator transcription factor [Caldalkalibacillus thermarum TA2.A1]
MKSVLIVDDHEVVRDGLSLLLRQHFDIKQIDYASEGREALQFIMQNDYDFVLLDLSMPVGLDGLSTAKQIKQIDPQMKIVIFSMYDEEVYVRQAWECGVEAFIIKEWKGDKIITSVRNVLAEQRVFPENFQPVTEEDKQISVLPLSEREQEVFMLTLLGYSQAQIADKLHISIKTVENHRRNISRKIGSSHKREWLKRAKASGLLDLYVQ